MILENIQTQQSIEVGIDKGKIYIAHKIAETAQLPIKMNKAETEQLVKDLQERIKELA